MQVYAERRAFCVVDCSRESGMNFNESTLPIRHLDLAAHKTEDNNNRTRKSWVQNGAKSRQSLYLTI
jgi:hypothetical protein